MIDSAGYAELLGRKPILWHRAWDATPETVESILTNGLAHPGHSNYVGFWESRPGCVYIGERSYARNLKPKADEEKPWALFAVDVAQLERVRINPDEDTFSNYGTGSAKFAIDGQPDGKHVCCHFHIPPPPNGNLWDWGNWLGAPLPTLGQWADGVGLGDDPRCTLYAVRRGRSLAYRGVVPPNALRLEECQVELDPEEIARTTPHHAKSWQTTPWPNSPCHITPRPTAPYVPQTNTSEGQ